MSSSNLLLLPYELRQQILRLCVKQAGTIELQEPLWAGREQFISVPLFYVSSQLRNEALEAFYKTNTFLWIIEVDRLKPRTDPAAYPIAIPSRNTTSDVSAALPWYYPNLLQHLRHLHVNVYLPDVETKTLWEHDFPQSLSRFVSALDRGRKLHSAVFLLTSKHRNIRRVDLTKQQLDVLRILFEMNVSGEVRVVTRRDFGPTKYSIDNLQLERNMKA